MEKQRISIRLVIDGVYSFYVDRYLRAKQQKKINFLGFQEYIKNKVYIDNLNENPVISINSTCYFGSKEKNEDKERIEYFARIGHANINKRDLAMKKDDKRGLKEDGVDSTLIVDTLSSYYGTSKFDYLVLFAGDSDYIPLVQNLRNDGVKVIIIYTDCTVGNNVTETAQSLLEEADEAINLQALAFERVNPVVASIFETIKPEDTPIRNIDYSEPIIGEKLDAVVTWELFRKAIQASRRDEQAFSPVGDVQRNLKRLLNTDYLPCPINKYLNDYKDKIIYDREYNVVKFTNEVFVKEILPTF